MYSLPTDYHSGQKRRQVNDSTFACKSTSGGAGKRTTVRVIALRFLQARWTTIQFFAREPESCSNQLGQVWALHARPQLLYSIQYSKDRVVRTVGADHRRCRTFRSADAAPPTGARADAASARSSASIMCPQNPPTSIFRATCTCAPRPRHARARGREWAARARTFFGSGESPQTSQTVWPSESGEAHSTSTRSSSTSNSSGLARGARARVSPSGLAGGGGQQRGGRAGTRAPPRRHRGHGAAGLACGTRGGRCP